MKKRTYRIEVASGFMGKLLSELKAWGVRESSYQVADDSLCTESANVVDVATETFINAPHLLTVTTHSASD